MIWKKIQEEVLSAVRWQRIFWVLVFLVVKWLLKLILNIIVFVQTICWLWTGKKSDKVGEFTQILNRYFLQVINYVTFQTDYLPWPIGDLTKEEQCMPEK